MYPATKTRVHKVMVGPCAANNGDRTVAEWAFVHLGMAYGYGAKGGFVNEDCSDLALSCLYAAGKLPLNQGLPGQVNAETFATLGNNQGNIGQALSGNFHQDGPL